MRRALRVLTVVSFAAFLLAAALAFAPRASAQVPPADAGLDAGRPVLTTPATDIGAIFSGNGGDRSYLAGSKAFGAPVAPQGFGGLGLRGGSGSGLGVGELPRRPTCSVQQVRTEGALSIEEAAAVVRDGLRIKFGREPCAFRVGAFGLELSVKADGTVSRVKVSPVADAGSTGSDCLAAQAWGWAFPRRAKPTKVEASFVAAFPE